jgi:hypothetical protein
VRKVSNERQKQRKNGRCLGTNMSDTDWEKKKNFECQKREREEEREKERIFVVWVVSSSFKQFVVDVRGWDRGDLHRHPSISTKNSV